MEVVKLKPKINLLTVLRNVYHMILIVIYTNVNINQWLGVSCSF